MHEACCETVLDRRVLAVVLYALDEGAGAVSNSGERDLDLAHLQNDSGRDPLLRRRIINLGNPAVGYQNAALKAFRVFEGV